MADGGKIQAKFRREGGKPAKRRFSYEEIDKGQSCLRCGDRCQGFSLHKWRNACTNCGCMREDHDLIHDNLVTVCERLGLELKDHNETERTKEGAISLGYSWTPVGLSASKVEEFMNSLPSPIIPKLHSAGEKYRDRQLILQIPKQDLAPEYCRHLNDSVARENFYQFLDIRDETAFGLGQVEDYLTDDKPCSRCGKDVEAGEIGLYVDGKQEEECWHPACFTCTTCEEILVDLAHFVKDSQIYCERHYAELIMPRCAGCDELIFSGEYIRAMNENYHSGHFCCHNCDKTLSGHRYILREENPYCIGCYEDVFANICDECGDKIGTDSKDLSYMDRHWHESCFFCAMCKKSLVDKSFGTRDEKLYCNKCFEDNFATKCNGCGLCFKPGTKKMEYKGKEWHDKCFKCKNCSEPIGTRSFIPREDVIYCLTCYEDKFATKCKGCKKVISDGGVTYRNEPWHRECFICSGCKTCLARERFTSRDDKPYCTNCYGELFAKKCCGCKKPITGIGGTRFVSFEERHWHNDCFNCKRCDTSLVNQGFMTENDDVICAKCGQD
ncbi:prickle planar cell polarity protein 3-B-like [Antedon mediterranea]|uniref:prickle planar cell polarity protein 3-B-like n=1 Tax=Antedon mediterranea TaxID=105859 RepID=UPI003AF9A26B